MDPAERRDEEPEGGEATRLLRRISAGDRRAAEELLPLLYDELHRIARQSMGGPGAAPTLQPTAVLNEAWLRMEQAGSGGWEDRNHFLGVAARAMRSVVVDHVRARASHKRGGAHQRVDLDQALGRWEDTTTDLLELDKALDDLEQLDPSLARIVELRFFAGLPSSEIAAILSVSTRTVERGWATARSWLYLKLGGEPA